MRLLFLTPQLPYPPQQGTTIRNFNIIKHLAPRHEITLVSFGTTEELDNAEPLRRLCRRIDISSYPVRTIAQRVRSTLISPLPDMALRLQSTPMHTLVERSLGREEFEVVQVEGIEMARYAPMHLGYGRSNPPARSPRYVFDEHNAEYVLQRTAWQSDRRQIARWHAAAYSFVQWKKLERYERSVCREANAVVACSDTDSEAIRTLSTFHPSAAEGKANVTTIPNGVDTSHFVPSDQVCAKPLSELALIFAGKMDFRPNIDAMLWFCDEILPRLRAEIPLAHIVIVGQKPSRLVAKLNAHPGVEVTGWVPDTRPYIADAAVYVAPLRMGSGTRLKVLEAMAMGKAIVSTSRGAEGIDLQAGHHALIADTAEAFARQTAALLRDPTRRRALGQAARELAVSRYDWRAIVPKFEAVYRPVV